MLRYRNRPTVAGHAQCLLGFSFCLVITFIAPQGASHGELNQPFPQFQADRPQSVKIFGRIEGHPNIMLIYKCYNIWRLVTIIEGLVTNMKVVK